MGWEEFVPYERNDKSMENCKIKNLYNLEETMAKPLLDNLTYPWEALPKISEFIIELGNKLDKEIYELKGENIWIAKSANIYPTAFIKGPAIIGENAEVVDDAELESETEASSEASTETSTEAESTTENETTAAE